MSKIDSAVSLAPYTTFNIGGNAEYFSIAGEESDYKELIAFATEKQLSITIIGGGSNILVSDEGISGLVIKNDFTEIRYQELDDEVMVSVGSGVVFDKLVEDTVSKNYWGLENLSHIPGSVGATPIQNVGAYGVEVSSVIDSVQAIDVRTGDCKTFSNENCQFGYRDSFFKSREGKNFIVTRVVYRLQKNGEPKISYKDLKNYFKEELNPSAQKVREAVISIRSHKFPDWNKLGTAGSFFKNPIITPALLEELQLKYPDIPAFPVDDGLFKVSAGWLLDHVCNLRGYRQEQVGTYESQALVVVNYGLATATEVSDFANEVVRRVFEKTKINLVWEVTPLS